MNQDSRVAAGGWLVGASEKILEKGDITLSYCFQSKEDCEGNADGLYYFSMPTVPAVRNKRRISYNKKHFDRFKNEIAQIEPDVIHIFGTETWFQRQFAYMLRDMGLIDKTIVWIQGLTYHCARDYANSMTFGEIHRITLWEFIRGTNVAGIRKRLKYNGMGEIEEIGFLKNVFVRTDWDSACCLALNRELNFYNCNETLRDAFYVEKLWDIENVEKYSIFTTNYSSPLKGFHQMIEAMAIIVKEFPNAKLYTTGIDIINKPTGLDKRIREPSYFKELREKIFEYNLQDNIVFLGTLLEDEMRDRFITSHVFSSTSSIENSPNTVGEAMILGVPCVASDVGGVSSLLKHGEEGLLYPFSEYTMLAEYICRIFRSKELACDLSKRARKRALETHDKEQNYRALLSAYSKIYGFSEKN